MGAIDTAREIAKIAVTSGLSQEVITLLEKKNTLLLDQITALEKQVSLLKSENTVLKSKASKLELEKAGLQQQLNNLRPQHNRLDEVSEKFLGLLFEHDELPLEEIALSLNISNGTAKYHRDLLIQSEMIQQTRIGIQTAFGSGSCPSEYGLLSKGREYIVKISQQ